MSLIYDALRGLDSDADRVSVASHAPIQNNHLPGFRLSKGLLISSGVLIITATLAMVWMITPWFGKEESGVSDGQLAKQGSTVRIQSVLAATTSAGVATLESQTPSMAAVSQSGILAVKVVAGRLVQPVAEQVVTVPVTVVKKPVTAPVIKPMVKKVVTAPVVKTVVTAAVIKSVAKEVIVRKKPQERVPEKPNARDESDVNKKSSPAIVKKKDMSPIVKRRVAIVLAKRVRLLIRDGKWDQVSTQMQRLEALSGKDSMVLLRMRAYWKLSVNEDSDALSIYRRILDREPNDIPATLNSALAEWRMGYMHEASLRLKKLLEVYPANKQAFSLLNKLRRAQ